MSALEYFYSCRRELSVRFVFSKTPGASVLDCGSEFPSPSDAPSDRLGPERHGPPVCQEHNMSESSVTQRN